MTDPTAPATSPGDALAPGGSVALVTGGTRGLGLAVARELAADGYEVLLNYAHDEHAAREAGRLLSEDGGAPRLMRADIGHPLGVVRLLREIRRTHGRLDVLVHSAVAFHPAATTALGLGQQLRDGAVAVGPLLYGAARLAELMTPGRGRVVAVSSMCAHAVVPGGAGPGMAKAALETLVRYLAADFAARGVAVNAVAAGKIADARAEALPEPVLDGLRRRAPTGRLPTAEEVAGVVALLCRPEAGALHGQVLTVDGGACLT